MDRRNFRRHGAFTAYCNAVFNGGVFKKPPLDKGEQKSTRDPYESY